MQQLAPDIWIFDGDSVTFFGLPFTTRMTVIRLQNKELWVHSPIKLSEEIYAQLETLGIVRYLIAPNHLHHLYVNEWKIRYPSALCYGTSELIKKRSDLAFEASLNTEQSWPWAKNIEQEMFTGSPLMEECVFFHKASATLIVTDLIENFPKENFSYWQQLIAKKVGILAPNGQTPLDWRLSFLFSKNKARQHLDKLLAWQPKTIVMAHGKIIDKEAEAFLNHSFRWLK